MTGNFTFEQVWTLHLISVVKAEREAYLKPCDMLPPIAGPVSAQQRL